MPVGKSFERPRVPSSRSRGFTLLIMLGLVALMGLGLAMAGPAWQQQTAREREQQWLRVGEIYARALGSYVAASPGSLKQAPLQLEDLSLDTRFVGIRRHLRQAYRDPMQPQKPWTVLRDSQNRIVGVYSEARDEPFLQAAPPGSALQLRPGMQGYARWVFMTKAPGLPPVSLSKL